MNKAEMEVIKIYGHRSTCRCMRWVRGRYLVIRVPCTCNSDVMTRDKAFDQAESELGKMCKENHAAIVKRIKELEQPR